MKPAAFAYHRPDTLDEALALLADTGYDGKVLAGGQSLVPAMNFRLAQPAILVDLNRVTDLAYVRLDGNRLRVGAMTRHRTVERSDVVATHVPLLAETMPWIAHPQIRNRGTIGGSLAHADPAAELPAVMLALGATVVARRARDERRIPIADFFTGLFTTVLEPGEIVVEIDIPAMAPRTGTAFEEIARRHGDFALVGVAATVTLDANGACADARVALLSVGERPVLARQGAQSLIGRSLDDTACAEAAQVAAETEIDPVDDLHASAEYRRHLARVLVRRALVKAAARAGRAA